MAFKLNGDSTAKPVESILGSGVGHACRDVDESCVGHVASSRYWMMKTVQSRVMFRRGLDGLMD